MLLVAQPTRGVDIGAAEYIHSRLIQQRDEGTAILIISEDLDEILALTDRILVMYEGTIVGEADPRHVARDRLGLMMAGIDGDGRDDRSSAD
jgi:simple sugar transport system ATP-binding protein